MKKKSNITTDMGTISLPNFRTTADVTMNTRLKDGGIYIDWAGLTDIRAWIYSDAQKALAGRADVTIDQEDSTKAVLVYAGTKAQYPGINRLIIQARYNGSLKTYDRPVFNFVARTAEATGNVTIDDPETDVEIVVEDVSSSILDATILAAISAADRANEAAEAAEHMVDIHTGPAGADGKSPYIGENGHWYEWDDDTEQYVDTDTEAQGETGTTPDITIGTVTTAEPGTPAAATMTGTPEAPVLNLAIPKGVAGDIPNFTVGEVTTGQPGTPVVVTITGTPEAPVLNVQIPQGLQGNPGSSVDYPFELVNNATTNDATKAATAAVAKGLKDDITQLEAEVGDIDERTANLDADEEDVLFVTDSDSNIIAKIDKDGIETTSVRTKQTNPLFYKDKVFITDNGGNVILAIDSNGIKTTKIEAVNVLKNDWLGKKVATYGDSVTAVNNGDFVPPFVITQNNWGNRVAEYFNFGGQIGRGIGSTCFMWRGTSGGQVAWCKTDTGEYVNRNDSYTYDNYEGHITIPADCTPIRGDGCSWLRIVTMFPASIKSTIDAVLVMFHNDYHQDMDTAVEWVENSQTDPEWAASDEYETLGGDYNIGTVQGGVASVVMKLQAWMPQARIILMTPISGVYATDDGLDGNFDNTQSALMRKLASVVADIASRMSVPLIDNYGRDGINSLNRTSYIYDNIHPYTAKGSKALAASVIGQMKTILPAL